MAAARNLARRKLSKGPAKSELVPAWAPLARLLSNQVRPHSQEMGSVPIYATEEEAPASVGARVMERISPSELWRMATTG